MSKPVFPLFSLLASTLLITTAPAQSHREDIPIRTWQAPAYWDASSANRESTGRLKADITLSNPEIGTGSPLSGAAAFIAVVPCRLVDTRDDTLPSPFGPPSMSGNTVRTITVSENTRCKIPATALAYSLNFTVVPLQGTLAWLSAWPTPNRPAPEVSILNSLTGQIIANAAVVPGGTNGAFDVFVTHTANVVIDINGYYAARISLANGSALAPALAFGAEGVTGLYSSDDASTVSITTGGINRLTVRADGDLDLTGNVRKGGTLFLHNKGGTENTGIGLGALTVNTGPGNTASGFNALAKNTTGEHNTAVGWGALYENVAGGGIFPPFYSSDNTAIGSIALYNNTSGSGNTASGRSALNANTTGAANTASGLGALGSNTTGSANTAIGYAALQLKNTGNYNIAVGEYAGSGLYAGDYSIMIGNHGFSTDANTIRVGDSNQNRTFITGIRGITTGVANAIPVLIDSQGQLGTQSSSRRFKTDIQDIGNTSSNLMKLRPVSFHYLQQPKDRLEYGLIAEEVEEVYSDLVVKGADGQVETVQYQKLTPMLLNELQKQHRELQSAQEEIRTLKTMMAELLAQRSGERQP